MYKLITKHLWWLVPLLTAPAFIVSTQIGALALTGVILASATIEGLVVFFHLRQRPLSEKILVALPLIMHVVLTGGVLLFLERLLFKVPHVAVSSAVIIFAHYGLSYLASHHDAPLRPLMQDGSRLVALISVMYACTIFFAIIFYFGISYAYYGIPCILLPAGYITWRSWLHALPVRERWLHTVAFEIIFLETVVVVFLFGVAYTTAALFCALVYFLYSEYVMAADDDHGEHKNDKTISFLIVLAVLLLLILLAHSR